MANNVNAITSILSAGVFLRIKLTLDTRLCIRHLIPSTWFQVCYCDPTVLLRVCPWYADIVSVNGDSSILALTCAIVILPCCAVEWLF